MEGKICVPIHLWGKYLFMGGGVGNIPKSFDGRNLQNMTKETIAFCQNEEEDVVPYSENIFIVFFHKTTKPIVALFYKEPQCVEESRIYLLGSSLVTKMPALPVIGKKNLEKSFFHQEP